ncbi:hypothetical protein JX265_009196 [Neoarthrinium moseri]|uniref:Uncharacterized protein n=1 Tax=Neoarthrinium moseri TaxID=1658444 RepID=A0A9P9WGU9_9PEZI|nr:hypothetical protein JX265_009196 [Neoarthrinium moseri]
MGDMLEDVPVPTGSRESSWLTRKLGQRKSTKIYALPAKQVFEILDAYLQPDSGSTIKSAAQSIESLLPAPPVPENADCLSDLWILLLEMASQVPYDHPAQIKLSYFSPVAVRAINNDKDGFHFASRPEGLMLVLGEYHFPGGREGGLFEDIDAARWINSNAFVALLASSELPVAAHKGLWSLRDALEEPYSKKYSDSEISAAAQWILHAGQWLFRWIQVPQEVTSQDEQSTEPGSLWTDGGSGYSLERWRFWRQGFQSASEREEAKQETKMLSSKAVKLMDVLEANYVA